MAYVALKPKIVSSPHACLIPPFLHVSVDERECHSRPIYVGDKVIPLIVNGSPFEQW